MEGTNAWGGSEDKLTWRDLESVNLEKTADFLDDPWKTAVQAQEPTPHSSPSPANFYKTNPLVKVEPDEISPVEAIRKDLLHEAPTDLETPRNSTEEEKLYSLDATADDEELVQKVLTLQQRLKGEMVKVFKSQEAHSRQVEENKMLKEYVQNLMKSSSTQGTDRFGRPIAAERSSSLKKRPDVSLI